MSWTNLENKVVVVTGGAAGIGLAVVKGFVEVGGKVMIADFAEEVGVQALEEANQAGSGEAAFAKCDVTSKEDVDGLVKATIERWGSIDVLVNNAGINADNLSLRMKDEEWKKVIDINLTSTFLLSKYAIKKMLKSKYGRIVNITSIVGHTGNLGQSNYAASKAGIIGMTKSLAIEYAKKNITLNCVSPGFIQSRMTDNIIESVKAVLTSRIPMSRLGKGEDVANSVAFLSSDQASYITGETIHVNGGMYMA